jgi:hypothetical protein
MEVVYSQKHSYSKNKDSSCPCHRAASVGSAGSVESYEYPVGSYENKKRSGEGNGRQENWFF